MCTGRQTQRSEIVDRARRFGSTGWFKIREDDVWEFEVDSDRVSFFSLSYDPGTDTFSAWNAGASTPIWEQK